MSRKTFFDDVMEYAKNDIFNGERTQENYDEIIKSLETAFTFGKHKGKTVKNVLLTEPHYIVWLKESNVNKITINSLITGMAYRMMSMEQYARTYKNIDTRCDDGSEASSWDILTEN